LNRTLGLAKICVLCEIFANLAVWSAGRNGHITGISLLS
jgi:hypothetical protein